MERTPDWKETPHLSPMHPLIAYEWLYGLTECLHIVGFGLAIGSMAIVDLHLAGWGFPGTRPDAVLRELRPWFKLGVVLTTIAGLIILSTDTGRYLTHPVMIAKLVIFGLALGFHYSWHSRVARNLAPPRTARPVAAVSLVLWTLVVFCGIFYAFT